MTSRRPASLRRTISFVLLGVLVVAIVGLARRVRGAKPDVRRTSAGSPDGTEAVGQWQPPPQRFYEEVRGLLGARFAGVWRTDGGAGEGLVIGVSQLRADDHAALARVVEPYGLSFSIAAVRYSEARLLNIQRQVTDLLEDRQLSAGIGPDYPKNRVVVSTTRDAEPTLERLLSRFPAGSVYIGPPLPGTLYAPFGGRSL